MIDLNTLDETDYENLCFTVIKNVEVYNGNVYDDGIHIPTIGLGFNLRDSDSLTAVLNEMTGNDIPAGLQSDVAAVVANNFTADTGGTIDQLNDILADYSFTDPFLPSTFTLTSAQSEDIFLNTLFSPKDADLTTAITNFPNSADILDSNERVALFSLAYNAPSLIGTHLVTDIVNGDRAEAWYEIRYDSNANDLDGLAKRRYYESDIFSLYKDRSHVTDKEAMDVYKMLERHSDDISSYDADYQKMINTNVDSHGNPVNANHDYDTSIIQGGSVFTTTEDTQPAHDYLINTYASGPAAHGVAIDNIWVDYTATPDDPDPTHEQNAYSGTTGNDLIISGNGDDVLHGDLGDDIFVINGTGHKSISGDDGIDTVDFSHFPDGYTVYVDLSQGKYGVDPSLGTGIITGVENIVGKVNFYDNLKGDYHDNIIDGQGGSDTLAGGGGADTFVWGATYIGETTVIDGNSSDHIQLKSDLPLGNIAGFWEKDATGEWVGWFWEKSGTLNQNYPGGYSPSNVEFEVVSPHGGIPSFVTSTGQVVSLLDVAVNYDQWQRDHNHPGYPEPVPGSPGGSDPTTNPGDPYNPSDPSNNNPGNPSDPGNGDPGNGDPGNGDPGDGGDPGNGDPGDGGNPSDPTGGALTGINGIGDNGVRDPIAIDDGHVCFAIPDGLLSFPDDLETILQTYSPLIIDMNGNGIEVSDVNTHPVYWDVNNDGMKEASAWVGPNDALLVMDRNGNGIIDNHSELFGTNSVNGFTALSQLDSNHDGIIDANDAQFANLKIWIDANQDGISQANELQTLTEAGITSINLNYSTTYYQVNGNIIDSTSTVTMSDNSTKTIADAWFNVNMMNTLDDDLSTLKPEVFFLPELRGFGTVKDLSMQMSLDDTLLTKVATLSNMTLSQVLEANQNFDSLFKDMLYEWGGKTEANWQYHATYSDPRNIDFVAAIGGFDPAQFTELGPGGSYVFRNDGLWEKAVTYFEGNFLQETVLHGLFSGIHYYNSASGVVDGVTGLSSSGLSTIESAIAGTSDHAYAWSLVVKTVEAVVGVANLSTADYTALDNAIQASAPGWTLASMDNATLNSLPDQNATAGIDTTLNGTPFDDHLSGSTGNDTMIGGMGDDTLGGGDGNDTYEGGLGTNFYYEMNTTGDDTYIYGGGHDYIFGEIYGNDKIVFNDPGITLSSLSIEILNYADHSNPNIYGQDDMVIHIQGQGDITIMADTTPYAGSNSTSEIETIQFHDGSTLDLNHINDIVYGTSGNDNMVGADRSYFLDDRLDAGEGDNTLNGGLGHNYLSAGSGNDTYIYGGGLDTISDTGGTDKVVFASSYDPAKFTFNFDPNQSFSAGGTDLQVLYDGHVVAVLSHEFDFGTTHFIEQVVVDGVHTFDIASMDWTQNGTSGSDNMTAIASDAITTNTLNGMDGNDSLTGAYNHTAILNGGAGDDYLYGQNLNDTLTGGPGNDYMAGGDGNDTYNIALGDGQDTVYDNVYSGDVHNNIVFTSGIGAHDLWFEASGNDLIISVLGTDQKIDVVQWTDGSGNSTMDSLKISDLLQLDKADIGTLITAMHSASPSGPPASLDALGTTAHDTIVALEDQKWHAPTS